MTRDCACVWLATLCIALSSTLTTTAAAEPRIPGFERFYQAAGADKVSGGRLLLGELSCTSCHQADAAHAAGILRKQAPILSEVGSRVRPEYLYQFLADPQATKPGTSMPSLFAGLSPVERDAQVDLLVHFLASTGKIADTPAPTSLAQQGEQLFHSVGCVACHDARRDDSPALKTSVPLGKLEPKYTVNGLTAFLKNPHHVRPSGRMPSLNLNDDEARKIAAYLLKDLKVAAVLTYDYYEGDWQRLPDFKKLKPKASVSAGSLDVQLGRADRFGVVFQSFLAIDKTADYKFRLGSDDGSRLLIDNREVVNNDGVHAQQYREGQVKLEAGVHRLVIEYFDQGAHNTLSLEIEGGGLKRQSILGVLRATKEAKDEDDRRFVVDPGKVEKGRALFASMGCASCHQMKDVKAMPALTAPPLASLKAGQGCLGAKSQKHVPHFSLSTQQQAALQSALGAAKQAATLAPAAQIAHTMTSFNCYACHERDQQGGVERSRNAWFLSNQKEMGDEGRIPPTLTGVGGKLKSQWLKHVFDQGAKDRPYMFTRMPKFGSENTGQLVQLLQSNDKPAVAKEIKTDVALRKLKASGRQLAGAQAFSCIKCHSFGKFKATGIQAMALTTMTQRLNEDWFHQYMLNPQAYRPGTRMPASWPNGQVLLPKILDGTADTQIHALWTYLLDGDKAAVPSGLQNNPIELIAYDEPVLYRNFIEGAGPRAIGVGYPAKVNLAFDAQNLRLAVLWHNAFIDASKHWVGRGPGYQRPLGDNILTLPDVVTFAVLESPDAKWPQQKARELGYRFRGYRLDDQQQPTFMYEVHGARIEDKPEPMNDDQFAPLRRHIKVTSPKAIDGMYYRVVGGNVKQLGDGWFEVDGTWKTRVDGLDPAQLIVRKIDGKTEVLVPLAVAREFVQEYLW